MRRFVLLTLATAAGFAALACALPALAQTKQAATTPTVKVRVLAGKHLVVDQHPVVVLQDDKEGGIVRELPPRPSPGGSATTASRSTARSSWAAARWHRD